MASRKSVVFGTFFEEPSVESVHCRGRDGFVNLMLLVLLFVVLVFVLLWGRIVDVIDEG